MNHLGRAVLMKETPTHFMGPEQIPFFDTATEDFVVAVLRGGKGCPGWKAVQEEAASTIRRWFWPDGEDGYNGWRHISSSPIYLWQQNVVQRSIQRQYRTLQVWL